MAEKQHTWEGEETQQLQWFYSGRKKVNKMNRMQIQNPKCLRHIHKCSGAGTHERI